MENIYCAYLRFYGTIISVTVSVVWGKETRVGPECCTGLSTW